MRFLYITDVHLKGVNPGRRKDIYYIAILKKLWELEHVIKSQKIDFVVIGGDLFDMPKISNKLYSMLAKIMRSWKVKIFVVPGNHDVFGQNIDTLEHTSLGALASSGVVTLMTRDNSPYYFQKKSDPNCPLIAFTGQEYYSDIDTGVKNDYEIEPSTAQFNVLVTHSMLVDKAFHPDVAHTTMDNVSTLADLVLSGHYHPERFDVKKGNTLFIKPRATARLEATKHNIDYKPEYVIIDVDKNGFKPVFYEYATAEDGAKIFDIDSLVNEKVHKDTLKAFQKTITDIDIKDANNINDIFNKVSSTMGVDKKHVDAALFRLTLAQKNQGDKVLNSYIPSLLPIHFATLIMKNFQSHEDTIIHFDANSLNALIGPSDNGKTAILRIIEWILYNEPKGSDFIRNGEDFCEGTLILSNGNKVTRRRTRTGSGEYELYDDSTGKTEKYTGFGHTIPMEVFNIHQMPKITVGKNVISFNIAKQLEAPFMLGLSDFDKATFIGKITGVEPVDDAIKECSKEISNAQKSIKTIEKDIDSLTLKLDNFKGLDKKLNDINTLESMIKQMDALENEINEYKDIQKAINDFNINLAIETQEYNKYANLDELDKLITKLELEYQMYLSYSAINSDYINCSYEIEQEQRKIKAIPDLDNLNSLIDIISVEHTHLRDLSQLRSESSNVENEIATENNLLNELNKLDEKNILEMESLYSYYNQLSELYAELNQNYNEILWCTQEINSHTDSIDNAKSRYKKLLNEMGTCPICHNHLDKETIDTIDL